MQLTLAHHPITDFQFGAPARLDGTALIVNPAELRSLLLEDDSIVSIDFDIVRPGEACRAGPIFDVIEPRAKAPGSGSDFPGILAAPITAGVGTTHVLLGAAVSVLAEISPDLTRSATGRVLEMSGAPAEASDYAALTHLLVIPHTKPGLTRQAIEKVYRASASPRSTSRFFTAPTPMACCRLCFIPMNGSTAPSCRRCIPGSAARRPIFIKIIRSFSISTAAITRAKSTSLARSQPSQALT